MKRHIGVIGLILLMAIALIGCSSANGPAVPETLNDTIENNQTSTDKETPNQEPADKENEANQEDQENPSESENAGDTESEREPYYFDNLELTTLDGETAHLHDYEGQLIILNFWATWCKYCVKEMPLLDELNAKDGYTVLAVNVGEDPDTVNTYLEDYDYSMPIMMDEKNELAASFGVNAFPTSIFIGPDFEYYYTFPGMIDDATLNQLLDAIQSYQDSKE